MRLLKARAPAGLICMRGCAVTLAEPLKKSRETTREACVAHRVGALFAPSLAVGPSETIRDVVCRLPTCVTEVVRNEN